jgi:arsenite methyltransferase
MESICLYKSPELREITGATIRPGGFELTGRGVEICRLIEGSVVLDIGCGLGATVNLLETTYGLKAYGLDAASSLLQEGQSLYPSNFMVAGLAERLPIREKVFDGIFCECVLSLLNCPERALVEFGKTLKPDGWLVITDLYARSVSDVAAPDKLPLQSCLAGMRPLQEILRLVAEAGFNPVLWEDHSKLLKQLAAKIVFEMGSMDKFWAQFTSEGTVPRLKCSFQQARPGYYLLAARKKEE